MHFLNLLNVEKLQANVRLGEVMGEAGGRFGAVGVKNKGDCYVSRSGEVT
jgi:hypothetical protein